MIKNIFLILGGEDVKKRPRSKKLIQILQQMPNLNWDETKIILSGLAGFKFDVENSEVSFMKYYLVKKNIPINSLILEEGSMDTLGNFVFSYEIVHKLLQQNLLEDSNGCDVNIYLITEGFHMKRSKELFLKIFSNLIKFYPKLNFNFIKANTLGISSFYWKRKVLVIAEKIKRTTFNKDDFLDYFDKSFNLGSKHAIDLIILDHILSDVHNYNLNSIEDFENYLYSLPVYDEKYAPNKKLLLYSSYYVKLINLLLSNRNKKSN